MSSTAGRSNGRASGDSAMAVITAGSAPDSDTVAVRTPSIEPRIHRARDIPFSSVMVLNGAMSPPSLVRHCTRSPRSGWPASSTTVTATGSGNNVPIRATCPSPSVTRTCRVLGPPWSVQATNDADSNTASASLMVLSRPRRRAGRDRERAIDRTPWLSDGRSVAIVALYFDDGYGGWRVSGGRGRREAGGREGRVRTVRRRRRAIRPTARPPSACPPILAR